MEGRATPALLHLALVAKKSSALAWLNHSEHSSGGGARLPMFTLAGGSLSKASRLLRGVSVSATGQYLAQSSLFGQLVTTWLTESLPRTEAATCESRGAHVAKLLRQEESIKASTR